MTSSAAATRAAAPELLGAQRPRIASVPVYTASSGPEVLELAAQAGQPMDDWQGHVLTGSLGERADGNWSAPEVVLIVPRQNGKGPHALSTPILTTDGWTTIGGIQPGQYVYDGGGEPCRVVACSEVFTGLGCFDVTFTDGSRHTVAAGHLWHVRRKDGDVWMDVPTEELAQSVGGRRPDDGRMEYNWRVRCDAVPNTPEVDLPIDPYLLGYWLGDGSSGSAALTVGHGDLEWLSWRVEAAGANVESVIVKDHGKALSLSFRITKKWARDGFRSRMRALGILHVKHIPEIYLTASPKQRLQLLAGLMDSDGSIATTNRSPQVEFTTSVPALAEGFWRLARSLGIRVTARPGPSSLGGKRYRDRVRFLWTPSFNPFEIPRKSASFRPPSSRRHELMSITSVEPVASVPTRCIQIDRPDGIYLVGYGFTPTHNSIIETRIISGLSLFDEQLILYSSHEFKTSVETFRRTLSLVENSKDLARRKTRVVRSTNELGIEFKGGQRVRFVARSGGSGRGFTGDCVILDEAYSLDDRHMDAMLPTLSARENSQIWYTSSAGMLTSVQLGRMRRQGLARAPGLAFYEWSVRARQLGDEVDDDHDDRANWATANPGLGIRISVERIERERRGMSAEGFARERLGVGEYPADEQKWTVISAEDWAALADLDAARPQPVAFAADVTPGRTHGTIGAAGRGAAGQMHVEVIDHRPGTAWMVDRAVELVGRWRPVAFALDPAGEAGSLIGPLEAAGVEVVTMSARDSAQAHGQFMELVSDSKMLRHRDDGDLNEAVAGAAQRDLSGAKAWDRRGPSVVLSPLVVVTAAAWAFTKYAPVAADPGVWVL